MIEGTNASLARLDLEYVDLLYAHRPDRQTPLEETVRAFNHPLKLERHWYAYNLASKLRGVIADMTSQYWGTSEWSAQEIATACGICDRLNLIKPVMEQPHYNMLSVTVLMRTRNPMTNLDV